MIVQFPQKIKPKKSYWVFPRMAFLIEATDGKDLEQQVSELLGEFDKLGCMGSIKPIIEPRD